MSSSSAISVLVTGASGMLGSTIFEKASQMGHKTWATARKNRFNLPANCFHECDLRDLNSTKRLLNNLAPDLVIHCAAITDDSLCTRERELCRRLHVDSSAELARQQTAAGRRFIHISTEAVYGSDGQLHDESDAPNPESYYAETKEEGERAVIESAPYALILRVTPVGFRIDDSGNSLAEWIVRTVKKGDTVNGYDDVFFTPVSSCQVAQFVLEPVVASLNGIYNLASVPAVSKYTFARLLADELDLDISQVNRSLKFADGRLHQGGMLTHKLQRDLPGWHPPNFQSVIKSMVQYLNQCNQGLKHA
jgi:dTDP-4-dehydrorhamnose reductase